LAAKTEEVTELEAQVGSLNASLENAVADANAQRLALEQLEQAKATSDTRLQEATETLEKLRSEYQESGALLQAVHQEVCL
jgi:conserved oligomeric Golgi complex subunit 6